MTDPVGFGERADATTTETQNLTQDELMRIIRISMPAAVVGLAILASLYTMYFAADLILPIFLAQFLGIILRPMVRGMQRFGVHRSLGALIALTGLVGIIVIGLINLSGPAEKWLHRLPTIQKEIELKVWPVTESIKQAKKATASIEHIGDAAGALAKKSEVTIKAPSYLNRIFDSTLLTSVQILIIVALTFYFLTQSSGQARRPFSDLPWLKHSDLVADMFATVQASITRFLQISACVYFILGAITALAMYLLEMPNPVLWGVLAAVLGFVPYVGPMIVVGCIGIVSLLTFETWWQILMPPLSYGILTVIEGNFITPTILGRHLRLNPIAVFLSMLLWTWVWGIAGAVLAVPILVIIVIVARHIALIIRETTGAPTVQPPAPKAA